MCRHCGVVLTSPRLRARGFCCHGCEGAHVLISSLGLDGFYRMRQRAGRESVFRPLTDSGDERFGYLDDEAFQAQYVHHDSAALGHIVFSVPAIQCAACVWLLEKLPEVVSDIARVRVDIVRGRAAVWFNPTAAKLSVIARTMAGLGYSPHPITPDAPALGAEDDQLARQLGVAAFCAMNVMLLFVARYQGLFSGMEAQFTRLFAWASLGLSLPAVFFCAEPFLRGAMAGLRVRRLHLDLPISIAIVGGFTASVVNTIFGRDDVYFDTVTALVFLLLVGRWFQRRAMKRVGDASDILFALTPLSALRETAGGNREEVYVRAIRAGDRIVVAPGQVVPCDGVVVRGRGSVSNAFLTGESEPSAVSPGSEVWSGARNSGGELVVRARLVGEFTRLGKLVEGARDSAIAGGEAARFVDRVSVYFVWVVLLAAAAVFLAILPQGFWPAWDRVMALLVVTCPCALGIATPIVLHLAGARAGRLGILLRSGESLERLAGAHTIFLDKTGTVTTGVLSLNRVDPIKEEEGLPLLWSGLAALEQGIAHPIADVLRREAEKRAPFPLELASRSFESGGGVRGLLPNGVAVRVGSLEWLERQGVEITTSVRTVKERHLDEGLSTAAFAYGFDVIALFGLGDRLRPEAQDVVHELRVRGLKPVLVSGDSPGIVSRCGHVLGMTRREIHGGCSPEQKAALVRRERAGSIFVGDGFNDAAALAAADVGIGVTGGAEAALTVSDIFLLKPDLTLVLQAVDGARAARRLIRVHLGISALYNITAGLLAGLGYMSPLAAALVMPASSLTVIGVSLWGAPFRGGPR